MTDENTPVEKTCFPYPYYITTTITEREHLLGLIFFITFTCAIVLTIAYPESKELRIPPFVVFMLFLAAGLIFGNFFSRRSLIELDKLCITIKSQPDTQINFADIKDYKISWPHGRSQIMSLSITLWDGEKVFLECNGFFAKQEGFKKFMMDFDEVLHQWMFTNNIHINRQKSFVESYWYLGAVVLMALGLVFALFMGRPIGGAFFAGIAFVIGGWETYQRARNRNRDNR